MATFEPAGATAPVSDALNTSGLFPTNPLGVRGLLAGFSELLARAAMLLIKLEVLS
jgi:hypothetical protein